jgi:hypothetical protein
VKSLINHTVPLPQQCRSLPRANNSGRKVRYHEGRLMRPELSPDIQATASPTEHPGRLLHVPYDWYISDGGGFSPSSITATVGDKINFLPSCAGSLKIGKTRISSPYTVAGSVTVTFSPDSGSSGDKTGTITIGTPPPPPLRPCP